MSEISLGSPKLNDATAEYERAANRAMNIVFGFINAQGPTILNRAMFTNKVSLDDRKADHAVGKDNPEWWAQILESQRAALKPELQGTVEGDFAVLFEAGKLHEEMTKGEGSNGSS